MKPLKLLLVIFLLSAVALPASAQGRASRTSSAQAAYGVAPMSPRYGKAKKKKLKTKATFSRKTKRAAKEASSRRRRSGA